MRARRNRRKAPERTHAVRRFGAACVELCAAWWKAALAVPATAAVVLLVLAGTQLLLDQRVQKLVVEGTFQRVSPLQVEAALSAVPGQGFLSIDLAALRRAVRSIEWVDAVQVRRSWPDTIVVHIKEHQAAARWGEQGLLNVRGELFVADTRHAYPELPLLRGPRGSERQVANRYLALRGRLVEANLMLESLTLDERGAWHFKLAGGQEIRLGREDIDERLARFFTVAAPALAPDLDRVQHVDLRYTNGFAVGWLDGDATGSDTGVALSARGMANRG